MVIMVIYGPASFKITREFQNHSDFNNIYKILTNVDPGVLATGEEVNINPTVVPKMFPLEFPSGFCAHCLNHTGITRSDTSTNPTRHGRHNVIQSHTDTINNLYYYT